MGANRELSPRYGLDGVMNSGTAARRAMVTKPAQDVPESDSRFIESLLGGISLKGLEAFCRRMATGLRAGVDILRLLEMEARIGSERHREVARGLAQQLHGGNSFAQAMQYQGHYFPVLLIKMVDAGEHAGGLDRVFREMADYYHDLKKTRNDFLSQITWPIIQLGIAIMVGAILIMVNGFFTSGSSNERAFDLTGVGLRGASGVMLYFIYLGLFFGALSLIGFGIWKNWFDCHQRLMPLLRNVPVIGTVITTTALSRLSMTLSMMLGAGVDAKRSVRDSLLSTGNHYYISGIKKTMAEIERGKQFSEALDAPKRLPDEFIEMVAVGELSGSESESLERLAETYREKARLALKQLAIISGVLIWMMIAAIIIVAIFTIAFQIMGVYQDALNFK
jgi:type IV pilus assembly protein PilC